MTRQRRRAMTAEFYPDGATYDGIQDILTDEQVARLRVGGRLDDDESNPLPYRGRVP